MTNEDNRRRKAIEQQEHPYIYGVAVRDHDIEPVAGLHWVAVLFRVMAVLLLLLMVAQLALGLTSTVELSYGVLFAEAIRLLIFAGLLWGFAALADLFVKSHHDLRASRILLARIAYRLREDPQAVPPAEEAGHVPGPGDAGYKH